MHILLLHIGRIFIRLHTARLSTTHNSYLFTQCFFYSAFIPHIFFLPQNKTSTRVAITYLYYCFLTISSISQN